MNRREFFASTLAAVGVVADVAPAQTTKPARGKLQAGAAMTNITPPIGASLAGYFTQSFSRDNHDELWVRAVVFDNGHTRVALGLCDLCVLPPEVVATAKKIIARDTGVPEANVAFAATHTHSAPATMHLFQSQADPKYLDFLTMRMADAVKMASARLQPARAGWAFGSEPRLVFNRRFHMKSGSVPPNPFGGIDQVRTNPGAGNPNVLKPAGPTDPTVGVLSVQTADGRPIAVVGNYSLHYVGGQTPRDVSADYFAYWGAEMARMMGVSLGPGDTQFVAMLMNGCQGDINNVDVREKAPPAQPYARMKQVANILAEESFRVMKTIRYSDELEIGASEEHIPLTVRMPSTDELATARKLLAGAPPNAELKEAPLVYARETVIIAETFPKSMDVPVQALRVGDLSISMFSGEPFVEMGLEMRAKAPFRSQFLIGLSNGHVGYVPTVAAHEQGGYETWRAKTSFLEKEAAPKMTAAMLRRVTALA